MFGPKLILNTTVYGLVYKTSRKMSLDENATFTKVEFAVQMTCQSCVTDIENTLKSTKGVKSYSINLQDEQVIVESILPSHVIHKLIEDTGRKAILRGQGTAHVGSPHHLGAAVSIMSGEINLQGVIRFVQVDQDTCVIDGTLDGLKPGLHGLHIHELGDISNGCQSLGDHYNPNNSNHGGPNVKEKHVGDLGNIEANERHRAQFRLENNEVKVWDVIGRSIVVTEDKDDLGKGESPLSKINGNSGRRISCGIIARSAGVFQNTKMICSCTGMTLWQERDLETPLSQL